jgi:hypothetical protein
MIPAVADAGIRWIATDEEVLSASTEGWVARDAAGFLRNPEMLYRPWRLEEKGKQLEIVFRDHAMSDQIGFQYQRYLPEHAVEDFFGKIEAIGNATGKNAGQRPTLVSIILDGENCWEHYHHGGVDFLRMLYRRIAAHPKISPVRIGDYLERYPAADKLGHLFPGSWIHHDFGIWIGHPECNKAWDLLDQTRRRLVEVAGAGALPRGQIDRAWEELYIAQGSDWFWWFGDSHTSAQDGLFDRLFRKHLQNVYLLLGHEPPGELSRPIGQGDRQRLHGEPTGLLNVKVDGRHTYFEWINAGHYVCRGSRGTMNMVASEGFVKDLYFGFDSRRLAIRLDARGGTCRERLSDVDEIRVCFFEPEGFELLVHGPAGKKPLVQLYQKGVSVAAPGVEAAVDQILELTVPFESLAASVDDPIQFYLELVRDKQTIERIPAEGAIETAVPSPDYELMMWQA